MPLPDEQFRPWREIARELAQETNRLRIVELSEELSEALRAQGMDVESRGFDVRKKTDDKGLMNSPDVFKK